MARCRHCREKFKVKYLNQKYCMIQDDCIKAHVEWSNEQIRKQWRREKKKREDKLKTRGDHEAELQKPINKIARLIDLNQPCMMCGSRKMRRKNACHYHSVGSSSSLRYHLFNIWIGCHSCNSIKGGNIIGYDDRLIDLYGREGWEVIKFDLKRDQEPLKLTIDEIKGRAVEARKIVRELERLSKTYTTKERWDMRLEINRRLDIYPDNLF